MTTKTTKSAPTMKTKKSKTWAARLSSFALVGVLSFLAPAGAAWGTGAAAAASTTKVPKLRTVEGEVCRKDGCAPIQGAVVYLQDTKSLAVKSYLSDDQGHFHFRELSMNLDYDLWAELNGKRSKTKSISQFNSKPELSYKLRLAAGK